jgi:hypothetical protein
VLFFRQAWPVPAMYADQKRKSGKRYKNSKLLFSVTSEFFTLRLKEEQRPSFKLLKYMAKAKVARSLLYIKHDGCNSRMNIGSGGFVWEIGVSKNKQPIRRARFENNKNKKQ